MQRKFIVLGWLLLQSFDLAKANKSNFKFLPSVRNPIISDSSFSRKRRHYNWRGGASTEKDSKDINTSPETSSTSSTKQAEGANTSWKESRKPEVTNDEDAPKKQGFRIPIIRFGLKQKTKENETTVDQNIGDKQTKPQGEEQDEKKLVENTRQSRFERAKKAREQRRQRGSTTNETDAENHQSLNETAANTTISPNTNKNITDAASGNNNETDSKGLELPQRPSTYSNGYPFGYPIAGSMVYPSRPMPHHAQGLPGSSRPMQPSQALAITAVISLLGVISRLWIVVWITKRLSQDEELISPKQHFVWECLNSRYTKDSAVLKKALSRPPFGIGKLRWNKYKKQLSNPKNKEKSQVPSKTSIVVNITPNGDLDLRYLSDVVNFLILAHQAQGFGPHVEVILLVASPGGAVTTFGLAAAQVARLESSGLNTTVCVDDVAASGGYMIASQSSQIVAAPFAVVGSIGVIREGLNYNEILEKHGVKPLVIKAGEMKNPLSSFGKVSEKDIKEETKRMEVVHKEFIALCQKNRPMLDVTVCDGTVLTASSAIKRGLVDRILTSDEYIFERIQQGDHVMKLHRTYSADHNRIFARALDVLPHLSARFKAMDKNRMVGRIFQGIAFCSMLRNKFL